MGHREEALAYVKGHARVRALALAFAEKYRSYGRFTGTYRVPKGAAEELSSFFGRKLAAGDAVSWKSFAAAWSETRFADVSIEDVLHTLGDAPLISKKEAQAEEARLVSSILSRLLARYSAGAAGKWLRLLQEGWKGDRTYRLARREDYGDEALLGEAAHILSKLPASYERLPFFANRTTGNPHALDGGSRLGKIFLQALSWLHPAIAPDDRTMLLYEARLLRDDIQNFATAFGIAADGATSLYWRAAAEAFAPINVPLREIVRAERFVSACGDTPFRVFIVENSGVFSALLDALTEAGRIVPLLCLHGQPKLASWALLDRLAAAGAELYYAGDCDPEGLVIAERILRCYPQAHAWQFDVRRFTPSAPLSDARLKKLDGVTHPALLPVKEALLQHRAGCYQESLFRELKDDVLGTMT